MQQKLEQVSGVSRVLLHDSKIDSRASSKWKARKDSSSAEIWRARWSSPAGISMNFVRLR